MKRPPDAVDDAGNAGEQFDGDPDRAAQRPGTDLGQEDRDADAGGHGQQHGEEGRHQRAVDRGQRAESLGHRIPGFGPDEGKAERLDRRHRADDQRRHHAGEDGSTVSAAMKVITRKRASRVPPFLTAAALSGILIICSAVAVSAIEERQSGGCRGSGAALRRSRDTHPTGVARKDHHSFAKLL